jgi:hypothetical protein
VVGNDEWGGDERREDPLVYVGFIYLDDLAAAVCLFVLTREALG